jgi:hypothetical protein
MCKKKYNLFTKTIIHIILHFYHILFLKNEYSMTTIFCLLFPLIISSSVFPFSIDRLAFRSVKIFFYPNILSMITCGLLFCPQFSPCASDHWYIRRLPNIFYFTTIIFLRHVTILWQKTTFEIIQFTRPYNHTATFRYHNFRIRQLLPDYKRLFQYFP